MESDFIHHPSAFHPEPRPPVPEKVSSPSPAVTLEAIMQAMKQTVSEGIAPLTSPLDRLEKAQSNPNFARHQELEKQKQEHHTASLRAIADIEKELSFMDDGSWRSSNPNLTPPAYPPAIPSNTSLLSNQHFSPPSNQQLQLRQQPWVQPRGPGHFGSNRFRAESLLKFWYGSDLNV